jgi:hypothetical protein
MRCRGFVFGVAVVVAGLRAEAAETSPSGR